MPRYGKMTPRFKSSWLEALRSGRYKQGQDRLRNEDDSFCCLGVLCDLNYQGKWERKAFGGGLTLNIWAIRGATTGLPKELADMTNITDMTEIKLMNMNDTGDNFETIANWIEANL